MAQARKTPARRTTTPATEVAVKRSVVRVLGLSIVTFGLYGLYWFYVTRVALDEQLGAARSLKQTPGMQLWGTLGLFVVGALLSIILIGIPILIAAAVIAVMLQYYLYKDISTARAKVGLSEFPALWYVLGPIIASVVLAFIPPLGILASIAQLVIFGLVVQALNEYWDKKYAGKAVAAPFTGGEIGTVVAGVVLLILQIVFLLGAILVALNLKDDTSELQKLQDELNNFDSSYTTE